MKRYMKSKLLSILLIIAMIGAFSAEGFAIGEPSEVFNGRVFVSDVKTQLAPGAVEHKITTNNTSGTDQNIDFLTEVDLNGTGTIKVMSCYAGYSTMSDGKVSWQMMTMPEQAQKAQSYFDAHQEKYPNYKVVGALVGDTYNMGTGQPSHVLVIDGVTYQQADGTYYFAIDKNGRAIITNSMDTSNMESAVGGMGLIVQNGQNVASVGNSYVDGSFSRAAIGITAEGKVVTFCTYGNSYPISCGYTWSEVADYLIAQGCVNALMLDGSGSAEWCARYEGTDNVVSVSHPSDGSSRAVGSCLLIVSTAAPDGVFARASVTPDMSVYTPDSIVHFSAVGADSAGNPAAVPDDAEWSLVDSSMGSIDSDGVFTSNGAQGDVKVNLVYDGKICGSATITIAAPDSITFSKPNEDVGRGKTSNLGLQVRYQNRDVILKDGDIVWTLTNDDETSDVAIGTIAFSDGKYLFTGNSSITCSGTVGAVSAFSSEIASSIQIRVGTDPVKALDFEIPGTGQSLMDYYGLDENNYVIGRQGGSVNISATGLLTRKFYGRGGNETARIVSGSEGYPVRSGSNALQVNYDFSKCAAGATEGANVGLTEAVDIPGHPTAIGLWVWVPENTPNLWLRVRLSIYNPNGALNTTTQFDFGPQVNETFPKDGTYGGLTICEEGTWYFCTADLSAYDGCTFSIPSGEAIRLMRTDGTAILSYGEKNITQSHGKYLKDGTEVPVDNLKGSIYFDDLMFIYGSVNEDTDAPRINGALVQPFGSDNQISFYDGMTVESNSSSYSFFMEDVLGSSGIDPVGLDYENCYLYVDGDLMNGKNGTVVDSGASSIRTDVTLSNGKHSIKLIVSDKNGNRSSKVYNFTVNGSENQYPMYSLRTDAEFAPLGGKVPLTIHTTDASGIREFTTTIQVDNRYKNGGYHITAAEGFSYEEGSARYDEVNNTVTFNVTSDGRKTGECDLATIEFDIDRTLAAGSYFSYTVTAGIETNVSSGTDESNFHSGFSLPQRRLKVEAPYSISSDLLYKNMATPGYVYVADSTGAFVPEIGIYRQDGSLLGTTDENGRWQVSSDLLATAQQILVYASCENGISFNETISIFDTEAEESAVIFTASENGITGKKLSWLSNIQESVTFRYAESEDTLQNAADTPVKKEVVKFGGTSFSNAVAAQVNSVNLDNLKQGQTYYYQYRYGDGEWKEAASFKVEKNSDTTRLFVLGDVQANDTTNIEAIINNLKKDEYALGIQTGDLVDQAYSFSHWTEALSLMSKLGDQDMLYALGNHENNMGDDGSIAQKVYQMPDKKYFSVEYDNVYVANISYNSINGYREALEWLVEDAGRSTAKWKLLAMHQPTYYTNSTATDNLGMDELMPSYLERAGINMVFTGHDHSYARTAALVNGKRSESYSAENETCNRGDGIVYYICGSSGEKSYPLDPTLPFDYNATTDFNAIYLTVEAAKDTLTVKTYDLVDATTGEASCIDTFTMFASSCVTKGHVFTEESNYDLNKKTLTCSSCGEPVSASESGYTGTVNAGEGHVYLFNGVAKTGWITIGEEVVHTGNDGILHNTLSFTTETCTENGTRMAYCEECGTTKSYGTNVKYHNHNYDSDYHCKNIYYDENHNLHECGWTGVDINTLDVSLGYKYGFYDGNARRPKVTVTDEEGNVLVNQSTYGDYVAYYSNNTEIGVATIRLVAYNSYYGERTIHFEVRPSNVETITVAEVTSNSIELNWDVSRGAEKYAVYQVSGNTLKKIADTADRSYKVTGLSSGTTYQFVIRPYTVLDKTEQRLDGSYDTTFWATRYSESVSVTTKSSGNTGGGGGGLPVAPTEKPSTDPTQSGNTTTTDMSGSTVSKGGQTTTTVDKQVADKLVETAVANKSEEIIISAVTKNQSAASGTKSSEVALPAETLQTIADKTNANIVIKTDVAEVKLDNKAAEAVASQAQAGTAGKNETVSIVAEKVKEEDKEVRFELKVVTSSGIVISDFKGGNAAVTVIVPKSLSNKKLVCVYIDENGHMHKVDGKLNTDGTYTFTTGHFSAYSVMAEEDVDKAIEEQKEAIRDIKFKLHSQLVKTKSGKKAVKLTWTNPSDIEFGGVEIYRSLKKTSGYGKKPLYISKSGKYTNSSVKAGNKYYYKVRGFIVINGEKVYTDYSYKAYRTVK